MENGKYAPRAIFQFANRRAVCIKTPSFAGCFDTPTQPPWAASFGYRNMVSSEPCSVYRGLVKPPVSVLRFYYLHQNLARDILIQLGLDAVYAERLDRLFEHDLLLGHAQTVLLVEFLCDFL